jgi:hypothetical protein
MKTACFVIALVGFALTARAEVVRMDVTKRTDVGTSGYEKVVGTIRFAIDPRNPRNAVIVDLDKAPVNAGGRVEFSADLHILRPKDTARSNGVALVEVSNRGNKNLLSLFSRATSGGRDPSTDADLGDGFLTNQGYTLVWVGWQFDAPRANMGVKLDAPTAAGLSAIVRGEFTPGQRATQTTLVDLASYAPVDAAGPDTTLTVRDGAYGREETIARDRWQLTGNTISLGSGFEPGRTYAVSYKAASLPVAGTGMAAFRDTASWLKHRTDTGMGTIRHAYAYGLSQSGRFLRTFLYYGFNSDEQGRLVYDGVLAHIAGASRLSLNERGATPNAGRAPTPAFPFADAASKDPISGRTEGLLENDRARANQPKVFYSNTSIEYWGGDRTAALVHTTPDGKADAVIPGNVRVYFLTGTQHVPARFPPRVSNGQQAENPVEYAWTMRALLVAMDKWVRQGTAPPASQYPKLSDGTLVRVDALDFPAIPGVQSPRLLPARREGTTPLPYLVAGVDADGNERSGIRTAEQFVPVATYTGWNFRSAALGGTSQVVGLMGSTIPFAPNAAARRQGDARRSIDERYPSKERYLSLAKEQSDRLVSGGYLRKEDVAQVMKRIEDQWALATGRHGVEH